METPPRNEVAAVAAQALQTSPIVYFYYEAAGSWLGRNARTFGGTWAESLARRYLVWKTCRRLLRMRSMCEALIEQTPNR